MTYVARPWPSSRKFKLPKNNSWPPEREVIVLELAAHDNLPAETKLALVSEEEMIQLAEHAAGIGAKLRSPRPDELTDFAIQTINDLCKQR